MRRRAMVLAALIVCPVTLRAQDARLVERLGPAARAGVVAELARAEERGLPTEPLVQKALEGAARGAQAERIVEVVRALRLRLEEARGALGESATESELVAGAGALHAGVPAGTLAEIRSTDRDRPADVPLVVLADLVQRGVPVGEASGAVLQLRSAGADAERFHVLRFRVERDIVSGTPPGRSAMEQAARIVRALRGGMEGRGGAAG